MEHQQTVSDKIEQVKFQVQELFNEWNNRKDNAVDFSYYRDKYSEIIDSLYNQPSKPTREIYPQQIRWICPECKKEIKGRRGEDNVIFQRVFDHKCKPTPGELIRDEPKWSRPDCKICGDTGRGMPTLGEPDGELCKCQQPVKFNNTLEADAHNGDEREIQPVSDLLLAKLDFYEWCLCKAQLAKCQDKERKTIGEWLEQNKHLFLGNFRGGDNMGNFIANLKQGKGVNDD